jgi:hypothetical protein
MKLFRAAGQHGSNIKYQDKLRGSLAEHLKREPLTYHF